MKKIISFFLFLPLFFFITNNTYCQWTKVWADSWVSKVEYINGIVFMSTGVGIVKSIDYGTNWLNAQNGLPLKSATAFGYADGIYYVGIEDDGLFKSTDEGNNWTSCNLKGIICDIESNNNQIYVGFNSFSSVTNKCYGIYTSADKGITFNCITNNFIYGQFSFVWAIAFNDTYLFNAAEGGIFRTSDNGQNWEEVFENNENDLGYIDSRALITIDNTVLWSTSSYIFSSSNNGDLWTKSTDKSAWELVKYKNFIFSKAIDLYYTSDKGISWTNYSDDFTDLDIFIDNFCIGAFDGKVFIGTQDGLYSKDIPTESGIDQKTNFNTPNVYYDNNNSILNIIKNNSTINSIRIFNSNGEELLPLNNDVSSIDCKGFSSGVYYITIISEGKIINNRFCIYN